MNHFIFSQTNPHALPFVRLNGRSGVLPAVAGMAMSGAQAQGMALEVVQRVTGLGAVRPAGDRARSPCSGSPTRATSTFTRAGELLRKVAVNPTRADLAAFIREGRNAVWPVLARIRDQTRIERTFQHCVSTLQRRVMAAD